MWQIARLKETEAKLAQIAALAHAPATPLAPMLASGRAAEYRRVRADCGPAPAATAVLRYAVRQGGIAWRPLALCPLARGPWDAIVVDRGVATALAGQPDPIPPALPPAGSVVGVLRAPGRAPLFDSDQLGRVRGGRIARIIDARALRSIAALLGARRPAPWLLVAESESPAPSGVTPAALPESIPNNHLGYALTWFGLAAATAGMALAWVWRRTRP